MSRINQCLEKYSILESGKPILSGYIINKFLHDIPVRTVCEWASLENTRNNFPPVDFNDVIRLKNYTKEGIRPCSQNLNRPVKRWSN